MPTYTNPADIARETFKLIASRRLLPTPDNYRKIYSEIAGEELPDDAAAELKKVVQRVAKQGAARQMQGLSKALDGKDWGAVEKSLVQLAGVRGAADGPQWPELIRELVRQLDRKVVGVTPSRKREALESVLIHFGSDVSLLPQKLAGLLKAWAEGAAQSDALVDDAIESDEEPAKPGEGTVAAVDGSKELRELLAQALELGVAARLTHFPDLADEANMLARKTREANGWSVMNGLGKDLKQFWFKLEVRSETDAAILAGVVDLLRLLIDNVGELVVDDEWLAGQVAVVQGALSAPMNSRALFEAERSLKELIYKQGQLKHSLNEAKDTLKSMIATFIDRLGQVSESTGEYQKKIEDYSEQISKTENIVVLNQILDNLLMDTRGMQLDMIRSRDEFIEARRRVEEADARILSLEQELQAVSEKVREDQLTGTLNRRGMEEAFEREFSRAERQNVPISVALMDVDNFKRLNDTFGHQAGDAALVHLAKVVQEMLRPSDVLARYGGEEFVILLPEASAADARQIMQRVQRELTKRFFLANNEKLFITFSAGVAERLPGELQDSIIGRADKAVYAAKAAGKNRVEVAV